jgi:anti-sigma factor RsiW
VTPPADEHRRFEEDLAAYVVGNLEGADRIALEAHLDQCERCRSDLEWLRPAAGALAASVPQLDPPRRLRRRILAAARSEQPAHRRWAVPAGVPRLAPLAGAFAAIAVAVVIAVSLLGDDTGPGSSTVAAQPAAALPAGAEGTLVVRDGMATLEVARMPRLASSQVYEAWLQRDGEIEPSSTFIVDRNGAGAATIPGVDGASRVMVTREPRGGSDSPTTAPLLQATL